MAGTDPRGPWRPVAPAELALVDRIETCAAGAIDPELLGAVRAAVASILGPGAVDGLPAAAGEPSTPPVPTDVVRACVDVAEQFVVDVAGTTATQRAALTEAMGRDTFTFVQVLYVTDVFGRLRIAFDRLGPPDPDPVAEPPPGRTAAVGVLAEEGDGGDGQVGTGDGAEEDDLWALLERFLALVARRDALDPLTAELVRLRGARAHDCRLCRSRLSVQALDAAGDRAVLDRDDLDHPDLDERHRVALRLTDALVTQPSTIDAALVAAVRERFTTDEIAELVLDVARNAANKIAVALGADAPVVDEGTEYFDLDATGTVVADVDMEVVRSATTR